MLATERLIEIELLCAGKAHHIEVLESDGGYNPMAFTEKGVAMLSSVLRSKPALQPQR